MLIPLSFVVFKVMSIGGHYHSYEENIKLINNIFERENIEVAFDLISPSRHFIFFGWLVLFFYISRQIKTYSLRIFYYCLLGTTIFNYIGGFLYTGILYKYLPIPFIIQASPVRAIEYFGIFLLLGLAKYLLVDLVEISKEYRLVLILFLMVFRVNDNERIFLSCLFLFAGLIIIHSLKKVKKLKFLENNSKQIFIAIVCLLMVKPIIVYCENFININAFKTINSYTLKKTDEKLFQDLIALRQQEFDLILLCVVYENGQYRVEKDANYISLKSKYIGDISNFSNSSSLYDIGKNRYAHVDIFIKDLNRGIDIDLLKYPFLKNDNVSLMISGNLDSKILNGILVNSFKFYNIYKSK